MSQNSKTAKMVLGRYYRVLNSRLALTRLAILNTWNKNTKTEVASRNNCSTPVRAGTTYRSIAVNADVHGRKTRPGMSEF